MASNTVLFRSIWVSNQILVKLSSQNGGNKSFVCWRCTDWQGMCFPTKNNNIVIFQSLFSNKTKVFSWNKDTGLSIFWFEGNLCQNQWALGWGPKVKIGQINKILWIQLGLYIRKPGEKSLTQKKLILIRGIAFEKNGPCSWENEVKISKKRKMAKNHFLRSYFGS